MKTLFRDPRVSGALLFGAVGGVALMWAFGLFGRGWLYAAALFGLGAVTAAIAGRGRVSPWLIGSAIVVTPMLVAVGRAVLSSRGSPLFSLWEWMLYGVAAFLGAVDWGRVLRGEVRRSEVGPYQGGLARALAVTGLALLGGFLIMYFLKPMTDRLFISKELYLSMMLPVAGVICGVCVGKGKEPRWVRWPVQIAMMVVLGGVIAFWATGEFKHDPLGPLGLIYMALLGVLPLIGAWAGMVIRALAQTAWSARRA